MIQMTESEYRKAQAFGSTDLKWALQSLAHFYANVVHKKEVKEPTKQMQIGTLVHAVALENKPLIDLVSVASKEQEDGRTKAGKDFKIQAELEGKIALTQSEFDSIFGMAEKCRNKIDQFALKFDVVRWHSEMSVFSENGLFKARADLLGQTSAGGFVLLDLKTISSDAKPRSFARQIEQQNYDFQLGYYSLMFDKFSNIKIDVAGWVVVENYQPFECVGYVMKANDCFNQQQRAQQLMDDVERAMLKNQWPGYEQPIYFIDLWG